MYRFMSDGSALENEAESCGELWSSLRSVTSAHGLPHVTRARGPIKKSFWSVIFLACSAGLVYNVYMITCQYFQFNVSVSLSIQPNSQLEFPAVTVCNNSPMRKSALEDNQATSPYKSSDEITTASKMSTTDYDGTMTTNEVTATANEMKITTNGVTTTDYEVSTASNEVSTPANDVSTAANDVFTAANEVSTAANEVAITNYKVTTTVNKVTMTANETTTEVNGETATANGDTTIESGSTITEQNSEDSTLTTTITRVKSRKKRALANCPYGWFESNGLCYFVSNSLSNWHNSKTACKNMYPSADLASFSDEAELTFIKEISVDITPAEFYMGIIADGYKWQAEDSNFTSWDYDEPDYSGQCVQLVRESRWLSSWYIWEDKACSSSNRYVCKKEKLTAVCDSGWTSSSDNVYCFYLSSAEGSWSWSRDKCLAMGSDLATIASIVEQSTVTSLMSIGHDYWIGLKYSWAFTDGTPNPTDDSYIWESYQESGESYGILTISGVTTNTALSDLQYICKMPVANTTYVVPDTTDCPYGWKNNGSFCYFISYAKQKWTAARTICKNIYPEADLVSFNSQEEITYVQSITTDVVNVEYNVGIMSDFTWVNGTSSYTKWKHGEPDFTGNCAVIRKSSSFFSSNVRWEDELCSDSNRYICRKETSACEAGWMSGGWHSSYCFYLSSSSVTWDEAFTACQALSASLATISSTSEETSIKSSMGTSQKYWIGFYRQPTSADGSPLQHNISMWATGEPSEKPYGVLSSAGVSLRDGDDTLYSVCKMNVSGWKGNITENIQDDESTIPPGTEGDGTTTAQSTESDGTIITPSTEEVSTTSSVNSIDTTKATSAHHEITMTDISPRASTTTQLMETTSTSKPLSDETQDVFAAVLTALETNVTSQEGIEGSPQSVEGSVYPERTDTRADFKAEEELIERLAALPLSSKMSLGFSNHDFIIDCKYAGHDCYLGDFVYFSNPVHGNCYTFNLGQNFSEGSKLSFKTGKRHGLHLVLDIVQDDYVSALSDVAGARIVAHSQQDMPFPEDEGVTVTPGTATFIGLKRTTTKRLGYPYGDCISNDESSIVRNVYEEHYSSIQYTVKACSKTCLQRNIVEKCGCASSHFPIKGMALGNTDSDVIVCESTNVTHSDCLYFVTDAFEKNELKCDCPPACSQVSYSKDVSSGLWPSDASLVETMVQYAQKVKDLFANTNDKEKYRRNLLKVVIYFEEFDVRMTEEKPAYRRSNYLSDLGGSIGLWIGMSLFTVFEFLEFLLDILVLTCSRLCSKKSKVYDLNQRNVRSKDLSEKETITSNTVTTQHIEISPISPPPPYSAQPRSRLKSSSSQHQAGFEGRAYGNESVMSSRSKKKPKRRIMPVIQASPEKRLDNSKVPSSRVAVIDPHKTPAYSFGW